MNIKANVKINYVIDCTIIAKTEEDIIKLAHAACEDLGFKCRIVKIISTEETNQKITFIF